MSPSGAETELRRAGLRLVSAGAQLAGAGLILPGEGNLSTRVAADRCLITPAGVDKGRLFVPELVSMSLDASELPARASMESRLHRTLYRTRPEVNAVVHAHPFWVQALAARGLTPDLEALVEAACLLTGVGWVDAQPPGSEGLAEAVGAALAENQVCVLKAHGAVTVGETVTEAVRRMMLLERLAAITARETGG